MLATMIEALIAALLCMFLMAKLYDTLYKERLHRVMFYVIIALINSAQQCIKSKFKTK